MLDDRKIIPTFAGKILEVTAAKGCPQGVVLSHMLWSLVVGKLTEGLNVNGCYTMGYTDDIAIPNSKKFLNTISQLLQENLSMVQQWCDRMQLSYQSTKDSNSSTYKEEGLSSLKEPTLSGCTLQLTTKVKCP